MSSGATLGLVFGEGINSDTVYLVEFLYSKDMFEIFKQI